jgi:hypothetical protein
MGAGLPGNFAALLRAEVTVGVPMWALTMLTDGWFSDLGRQHAGDDDAAAGARGGTATAVVSSATPGETTPSAESERVDR